MPKSISNSDRHFAELKRKMPNLNDEHGVHRFIALIFGFHKRCRDECRRTKKCVGAGAPCFDQFWWDLPEIRKDMFRETVKARIAGAKTADETEAIVFPKIMAHYTPEQIREAAAQAAKEG
jgi:hypothetical protein